MSQLQTQFYAGPLWLGRKGFPIEPFNPRDKAELVDQGFGGYWRQKGGPQKIKAIESGKLSVASTNTQEFQQHYQELEKVTFLSLLEDLNQEVLIELGIKNFSTNSVLAISSKLIQAEQRTAELEIGAFKWCLRRLTEAPITLPYVAQYALNYSKENQLPFSDFWIAEDQYIEPAHIQEARRRELIAKREAEKEARRELRSLRRAERASRPRRDPLLVGHWAFSSVYSALIWKQGIPKVSSLVKRAKEAISEPLLLQEKLRVAIDDISHPNFLDSWRGTFITEEFTEADKDQVLKKLQLFEKISKVRL